MGESAETLWLSIYVGCSYRDHKSRSSLVSFSLSFPFFLTYTDHIVRDSYLTFSLCAFCSRPPETLTDVKCPTVTAGTSDGVSSAHLSSSSFFLDTFILAPSPLHGTAPQNSWGLNLSARKSRKMRPGPVRLFSSYMCDGLSRVFWASVFYSENMECPFWGWNGGLVRRPQPLSLLGYVKEPHAETEWDRAHVKGP